MCTPNGAVSFISDPFMGSISDKELTEKSGLLQLLKDAPGSSVMADCGFLINDNLKKIGVGLNIPPFLEGKGQSRRHLRNGKLHHCAAFMLSAA